MTSESKAAFYKATKFWIVLLLALLIAAVLWQMFSDPSGPVPDGEETSRKSPRPKRLTQAEQRLAEGWVRFDLEVPDQLAFREHEFAQTVDAASKQRWFSPHERYEYEQAVLAWGRMQQHLERLASDRSFRAGEERLANLKHGPAFKVMNFLWVHAPPYLVCYVSRRPLHHWQLPDGPTFPQMLALRERRTRATRIVRRNASILSQLHDDFMRRFGKKLDLAPLGSPFGGASHLPLGVRSFSNGVVLPVIVLEDGGHWEQVFRQSVRQGFRARSGEIWIVDMRPHVLLRAEWINWFARHGAWQLLYWFARQRHRWRHPRPGQGLVSKGLTTWLGAGHLRPDRRYVVTGIDGWLLAEMRQSARLLEDRGKTYPLFGGDRLTGLTTQASVTGHAEAIWGIDSRTAVDLHQQQCWAYMYFLSVHEGGRWLWSIEKFLDLALDRQLGGTATAQAFREAFRIRDVRDWAPLDRAFETFVRERLLKMDPSEHAPEPPPLEAWDAPPRR